MIIGQFLFFLQNISQVFIRIVVIKKKIILITTLFYIFKIFF
jgi:hypothetical protein